jgi:cytidylate kinase
MHTSIIAKMPSIRNILKKYQVQFVKKNKGCVIEGRDASTKIIPKSDIKFYFICNLKTAARRRYKELKKTSKNINFNEVKRALYLRDLADRQRSISPLQKHPLAIVINSGILDKQKMLVKMSKYVEKILKIKYDN